MPVKGNSGVILEVSPKDKAEESARRPAMGERHPRARRAELPVRRRVASDSSWAPLLHPFPFPSPTLSRSIRTLLPLMDCTVELGPGSGGGVRGGGRGALPRLVFHLVNYVYRFCFSFRWGRQFSFLVSLLNLIIFFIYVFICKSIKLLHFWKSLPQITFPICTVNMSSNISPRLSSSPYPLSCNYPLLFLPFSISLHLPFHSSPSFRSDGHRTVTDQNKRQPPSFSWQKRPVLFPFFKLPVEFLDLPHVCSCYLNSWWLVITFTMIVCL